MKVLIGAIGLGRYVGTTYGFEDGTTQDADYFLYAITQHIKPDHLIVVATDKAKEPDLKNNKPSPLAELNEWIALENVPTTVIDIPNGKDRNEAWVIFNAIVEKYDVMFPKGSAQPEVYMDVTNGLRSIPILMLSIARYLQRSRQIDLRGIFYGAFDAVERSENVKPVYQVDSFMTVLDWASAVDTFLTTGNSVHLAEMLEMQNLAIENADEIADSLRDLSTALDLVRIEQIHQCADSLVKAISKVNTEDMAAEGRIIVELLHRLQSEFEPLAIATPQANMRTFLKKNLKLVLWYSNRNRYQDAMLIAREWILTYKMQNKNAKLKRSYSTSEIFDRSIRESEDGYYQWSVPDKKSLNEEINSVRNSLLHGGFSDEQSAQDMVDRIENVTAKLQKLEIAL
jgi:hypothetical protein